jgi:hypothetical protein
MVLSTIMATDGYLIRHYLLKRGDPLAFPERIADRQTTGGCAFNFGKAHRALAQSSYPKLLFAGNPSGLISPSFAQSFAKGLKNCRAAQLSSGIHYLQEDHPKVTSVCIFPARAVNRHVQVPSVTLHSPWPQSAAPEGGVARVAVVFRKPSSVTNLDR